MHRGLLPPAVCSPSPLADLTVITVTSQRGPGHLQQSQHLIKPQLPTSPTLPPSRTVPVGKASDGILILFPLPPPDGAGLAGWLSSEELQKELESGGSRNPQLSGNYMSNNNWRAGSVDPDSGRGEWHSNPGSHPDVAADRASLSRCLLRPSVHPGSQFGPCWGGRLFSVQLTTYSVSGVLLSPLS